MQEAPQVVNIRNVLASLYLNIDDAKRVIADAGLDARFIAFDGKAINYWQNILAEAQHRHKIDAILQIALKEYGENSELVKAYEWYLNAIGQIGCSTKPPQTSEQPVEHNQMDRHLELPYGTVSPTSTFYVNRQVDRECQDYFSHGRSVTVYVQAPRQMGKSSLMQRINYLTKRTDKFEIAYIDCEKFTAEQLHSLDEFLIEFCYMVSDALEIQEGIATYWAGTRRSSLIKCSNYISKHIVSKLNKPLILAMDEVERVLDSTFRNDFFGMLRTWHNDRAYDANMAKVSLFLSSSTEPQLFIDSPNQSPFNVARTIVLRDFTPAEVHELNQRHGAPLTQTQLTELMKLLDGHPFLTRLALYLVATQQYDFVTLQRTAIDEDGPFAVHLETLWQKVAGLSEPRQALAQICRHQTYPVDQIYYRLKGAGLVRRVGDKVVMRNQLYERYFAGRLYG